MPDPFDRADALASLPVPPAKDAAPPLRRPQHGAAAVLVLLAGLPYLNSLRNGFVYDDEQQILQNPYLRSLHHWREILTTPVWSYLGPDTAKYYRPVMSLGYLAGFQLAGPRPWLFHLVNLLLNAAVVLLVWKVSQRLFRRPGMAFLAAAIFALHPLHSEAVDWIAAVTDLELSLFYLLAFWFFLRLGEAPGGNRSRGAGTLAGMAASFALALASKEPAVTLAAVATGYEHLYRADRARTSPAVKISRYAPLWALVAVYFVVRARFLGGVFPSHPNTDLTSEQVWFSAIALVGQYVVKLLWPIHLCAYYLFSADWAALLPWAAVGATVIAASAAFVAYAWRRNRTLTFGVLWFFATLAPVLNPRWLAANAFAERYAYLPSVGFCWLLAAACLAVGSRAAAHRTAHLGWAGVAAAVAALSIARIVTRNRDWHDDVRLYTQTLRLDPQAYYIHNNLGQVYWDEGETEAAEREWRTALRLAPGAEVVLVNLGLLDTHRKRYGAAVAELERALELQPSDPAAHMNLALAYQGLGDTSKAEAELQTAVRLAPLNSRGRILLGERLMDDGHFAEAEQQFRQSLILRPTVEGWLDLGLTEWSLNRLPEAESAFKEAAKLDPASARPHFLLGLFYGTYGRRDQAEREYAAGFQRDPDNAEARANYRKLRARAGHDHETR